MYASGIPVGMVVDNKGPRPGVFVGSILLGVGYFFQYRGSCWECHGLISIKSMADASGQPLSLDPVLSACHCSAYFPC